MRRLLASILFVLVTPLFAHGGGHVLGTVAKITPQSIEVKASDGKLVEVPITSSTRFMVGEKSVTIDAVHAGSRVVVHRSKDGNAEEIHLPAEKSAQ